MRPPRGAPGGRPPNQPAGQLTGRLSLARALSKFGVCSRKEAARWIEAGRVRVGGAIVRFPARRIDPRKDVVTVDGRRVQDEKTRIVIALHKPVGCVTTRVDPGGRPTVYDLLGDVGRWVFPVGRLDRDSSGLLLFTNDHRLGERLTNPEANVPKTYHALVEGLPDAAALQALREGVGLQDGTETRPARVKTIGTLRGPKPRTWLEIVLTEGKNRQVRRMCASVGHDVVQLVRVRIGRLALGELSTGEWRRLDERDAKRLQGGGEPA
jgi:23S rRNA pseudouridine2605 synthase